MKVSQLEVFRVERSRTWKGKATLAPKNQGKFGAKTETLRRPKFCSVSYFNLLLYTIAFLCFFMPKMFFFIRKICLRLKYS